ncbi:unnamed protein product [Closterium sp. Naga37s-1]|nr:unnamed protein product [Closterium sp. Naga37s-1]
MDGNPFRRHHGHSRRGAFPFDPQPLEVNDDFSAPWPPAPVSAIANVSPAAASAAVSISHFLPTHFNPPDASAFGAAGGSPADRSAAAAQPFLRNEAQLSAPSAPPAPSAPSPAAALEFALLESQLLSAPQQQQQQQRRRHDEEAEEEEEEEEEDEEVEEEDEAEEEYEEEEQQHELQGFSSEGGLPAEPPAASAEAGLGLVGSEAADLSLVGSAVAGLELVGSAVAGLASDGADAFDLDAVEVARLGGDEAEEEGGEGEREGDGETGGVVGGRESRKRRLEDLGQTEGEEEGGVEGDVEEGEEEEGREGRSGKLKKGGEHKEGEGDGEEAKEGDGVNKGIALLYPSIPTTPSPLLCSEAEFQELLTCIQSSSNEDAIAMVLLLLLEEQRATKETSFFLKRLRVRSEYLLRHHSLVRSIELNLHRDIADNNAIRQQEIQRLRRVCMAGMTAGATLSQHQMVYRRLWTRPRSRAWWEECIDPNYPPETFRKTFRMSRETFMELCDILGPLIVKRSTRIREAIPVDIRIGASLWRLATAEPLHLISRRFGLGQTTVHFVSNDVLKALNEVVLPKVVVWPEPGSTRAAEISSQFLDLCGLDHASSVAQQLGNGKLIATLYTTHLPINTPRSNLAKYHNKQHTERFARPSYSIAMQTAIDANGQFLDLCIGLPGALSDEEVLQQSTLHQKGQAGELQGVKVIGLRSYPLLDWLLVPYAQSDSATWYQTTFNECIEKGTAVGKDAIGRLKGRWRILLRRAEGKLHELPRLVGACCALHNFLEQKGEAFDPDWAYEAFDDFVPAKRADEESPAAVAERDALAQGMFQAVHGWEGDAANAL